MPQMDIDNKRKIVAILKILHENGQPMGSAAISNHLAQWGIDLRERMIRNYLKMADREGLTLNLGRRGRTLTDLGRKELEVGIAIDKVGFVASRVDELSYKMTFDEQRKSGTVILNCSFIETSYFPETILREIAFVMRANLGMGHLLLLDHPGDNILNLEIPSGNFAIATVCSVTLNGVLLRHGIAMISRFGGLLELHEGKPVRFRQIINYDGSTLDPLEIFIKGKMTSVRQAARTGTGVIGASFREIPTIALPVAQNIIKKLEQIGLGGVLMMGKPHQPLLDIPVSSGRVGIIIAGGLNPIAALEETGIATQSSALHSLCDFAQLSDIDEI
jgi:repressor of nif and glnA expression